MLCCTQNNRNGTTLLATVLACTARCAGHGHETTDVSANNSQAPATRDYVLSHGSFMHATHTTVNICALLSAALRLPPLCFIVLLHAFCRADADADDLDNTNKSFQEGAFATLYTLTKSRQLDASLRLSVLKVVLEFLQASAGRLGIQCTATAVSSTQTVPAILWMSCMCCTLVGLL
jgi:hypothetical protein